MMHHPQRQDLRTRGRKSRSPLTFTITRRVGQKQQQLDRILRSPRMRQRHGIDANNRATAWGAVSACGVDNQLLWRGSGRQPASRDLWIVAYDADLQTIDYGDRAPVSQEG